MSGTSQESLLRGYAYVCAGHLMPGRYAFWDYVPIKYSDQDCISRLKIAAKRKLLLFTREESDATSGIQGMTVFHKHKQDIIITTVRVPNTQYQQHVLLCLLACSLRYMHETQTHVATRLILRDNKHAFWKTHNGQRLLSDWGFQSFAVAINDLRDIQLRHGAIRSLDMPEIVCTYDWRGSLNTRHKMRVSIMFPNSDQPAEYTPPHSDNTDEVVPRNSRRPSSSSHQHSSDAPNPPGWNESVVQWQTLYRIVRENDKHTTQILSIAAP